MYLIKPECELLKFFMSVQKTYDGYINLDSEFTVATRTDSISSSQATSNFNCGDYYALPFAPSLSRPIIKRLASKGLIKKCGTPFVYQVTLDGWFCKSIRRAEVLDLLLKDVLLPVIVSIITTIFTMSISGLIR